MSLQSVEKTSALGRVASRRNVVRGAAWSTAAVTIVVATPNVAAASDGGPHGAVTAASVPGTPFKWSNGSVKHVTWRITLTNSGTAPLTGLAIDFTYAEQKSPATALSVTSLSSYAGSTTQTWTMTSLMTAVYGTTLAVGETITVEAVFTSANNAGGSVTANIRADGTLPVLVSGAW